MVAELVLWIAGLLLIQTVVLIWMMRTGVKIMSQGLIDLDQSFATALKQLIEQGLGDFEPQNPILAAIASRLMQQPGGEILEVSRSDNGRFSQR